MAQLLIRNLDETTIDRLKARAARNRRSLQGEAKAIVEQAAEQDPEVFWENVGAFYRRMQASGRRFSDSAGLVREDRER